MRCRSVRTKLQPDVEALEGRLLLTARPSYNTGTGFYVVGREIYDANGNEFDIRGFSNSHWWGNTTNTFNAISEFPAAKANAVRAVFGPAIGGLQDSPAKREQVVEEYIRNGIVPIVEDHGASSSTDPAALQQVVDRWLDPANVQWLKQDEKYVILNIANEWGPDSSVWANAYINAVARLRAAGINCLLMIDAGGYGGQDIHSIDTWWKQIEDSDPQHNIVFSIHMYGYWVSGDKPGTNYALGSWGGGMPEDINTELDKAVQMNIPLVVGEFSWQGGDVNYNTSTAMKLFTQDNLGWLAWSWNGNSNPVYDMIANGGWQYISDADLTQFGNLVINDPVYGLKATSKQATIFGIPPTAAASQQVNLASSYNRTGIVNDGSAFSGGLDGGGSALSANLLGTSQTWMGTTFTIGPAGSSDVVSATGQTIALPAGQDGSLALLATAVNGNQPNLTFTVNYTDGTKATFTQSVSDWFTPQNYSGESKAVTMAYRDRSNGTEDNRTFFLYGYTFALNSAKTVRSLTLPNDANVELVAATLVPAHAATR